MCKKEVISPFVGAVSGVLSVLGFAAIPLAKPVVRNIIAWVALATITFSPYVNAQSDAPTQQLRPPAGFVAPPLNPTGVTLETRRIAEGVYALLANTPFTDNSGFVVGADAVLVVDSQFNGRMGQQVLDAVRRVTDKPIRYLVNTNAFGDHTFGNYVFPTETRVIAHRRTLEAMRGKTAEEIGRRMAATVDSDLSVFDGVKVRLPDEVFDDTWSVDLGGRRVEAHFFGAGMSPSDTVVYVPGAQVAWTGNLVFGENTIPWAQSGGIATYRQTLDRLSNALEITTIVPGHGALTTGSTVAKYVRYLDEVTTIVMQSHEDDTTSTDQLVSNASVPVAFPIEPSLVSLMTGFHRWNLQRAFREAK